MNRPLLQTAPGSSLCEWKGAESYWTWSTVTVAAARRVELPASVGAAEALATCVAFYLRELDCRVGREAVVPQPGFYAAGLRRSWGPVQEGAGHIGCS